MDTLTNDYEIKLDELHSVAYLSGSLRLHSPNAYETPFLSITDYIKDLTADQKFTINLADLDFLNSSGVTSIAKIVLLARSQNINLNIVCNNEIPWQEKTISSFNKLYNKVDIQFNS